MLASILKFFHPDLSSGREAYAGPGKPVRGYDAPARYTPHIWRVNPQALQGAGMIPGDWLRYENPMVVMTPQAVIQQPQGNGTVAGVRAIPGALLDPAIFRNGS